MQLLLRLKIYTVVTQGILCPYKETKPCWIQITCLSRNASISIDRAGMLCSMYAMLFVNATIYINKAK